MTVSSHERRDGFASHTSAAGRSESEPSRAGGSAPGLATTGAYDSPLQFSSNNAWFELLLSRIRYRATWRFSLAGSWPGAAGSTGPCLQISALVEDSTTGADLNLTHTFQVPPHVATGYYDEAASLDWVWQCVMAVERHEAREFFRVDGKRWVDPHRDNNTRLYQ